MVPVSHLAKLNWRWVLIGLSRHLHPTCHLLSLRVWDVQFLSKWTSPGSTNCQLGETVPSGVSKQAALFPVYISQWRWTTVITRCIPCDMDCHVIGTLLSIFNKIRHPVTRLCIRGKYNGYNFYNILETSGRHRPSLGRQSIFLCGNNNIL